MNNILYCKNNEYFTVQDKQRVYLKMLNKTKKALNRLNIPFFLSSGTCLGYYREGKFIDHDYDIDIGIFKEDYSINIIKEMKKEGFLLYRVWGRLDSGLELSFRLPKTVLGRRAKIDIFVHYNTDEHTSWYSYAPKKKKKIHYRVSRFGIKDVDFMGTTIGVPDLTLRYIQEHYGNDWFISKNRKDYKYYLDPTSIVQEKIARQ